MTRDLYAVAVASHHERIPTDKLNNIVEREMPWRTDESREQRMLTQFMTSS
jgi:hypothetical protein